MLDVGFKLGRKILSGGMYAALQKVVGKLERIVQEFGQGNEIATVALMPHPTARV